MYQTSEEVAEVILSYSRTWRIRLEEVGGDIIIMGDKITKAESEHSATTSSDDIELGAVCAAGWTITTSREGEYVGKQFKLYLYLVDLDTEATTLGDLYPNTIAEFSEMTLGDLYDMERTIGEPIPMGVLTCVKAPRCGDGRELHLYDKLYFTDKPYVKGIPTPALASDIEQDICDQLGIENATAGTDGGFLEVNASQYHRYRGLLVGEGEHYLFFPPVDFMISLNQFPKDVTMRQVLEYIAMIHGQFGCIDRVGRYTRRWFSVSSMATIDSDHADEPTVSEAENQIVGIRCKVDDETELTVGSMSGGRILELENPFMTNTLLRALFVQVKKMSWYAAQVTERLGDPRHDIGDTVTIESDGQEYDIPITMIQYSFDGGLIANISAAGLTEEEQTI